MNLRTKLAVVLAASATLTAFADIKVNDNLSFNGYAVGSYQYSKQKNVAAVDSFNIDSALLGSTITYKPVTGVISLYYAPTNDPFSPAHPTGTGETTILDAYVTYDVGSGVTVTAGRFLSYLGYESFYAIYDDQITFANGDFLAPIPGYHEGVRVDYSDNMQSAGIAGLDSVYSPYGATKGDGELQHNAGMEAYYSYKGFKDLTLWGGIAYDTKGHFATQTHSVFTFDLWASYQVSKELRVGAEYVNKDGGQSHPSLGSYTKGYNWLVAADYSFTDTVSLLGRVSGEKISDGGPGLTRYTISPTYKFNDHFKAQAEYSYTHYRDFTTNKADFYGVRILFQF